MRRMQLVLFLKLCLQQIDLSVQVIDSFLVITLDTAEMIDFILCRVEAITFISKVIMLLCEINMDDIKDNCFLLCFCMGEGNFAV